MPLPIPLPDVAFGPSDVVDIAATTLLVYYLLLLIRGTRAVPIIGGIALLASLHLLAAVGGEGLLEFDCHPNAGRELVVGSLLPVREGLVPVPQSPGLGAAPDLNGLRRYQSWPA